MNRVVGIIDMDGFTVTKKFYCRELGAIELGKDTADSQHFDMGICWQDLSVKDMKQCNFLTDKIHKLPFNNPCGTNTLPIGELKSVVQNFYQDIKRNDQSCIAYKGGHYERDLLKELAIPSVNLEKFGCPKASVLFDNMIWLETCGQHFGERAYEHCPRAEVLAFAQWFTAALAANTLGNKML